MITITIMDVITCVAISFTVALYLGAFVQRRKDAKEREALRSGMLSVIKLHQDIEKLVIALNECYSTIAALEKANEELKKEW